MLGLHLLALIDALRDSPADAAQLAAPTLFRVVKSYDLGVVASLRYRPVLHSIPTAGADLSPTWP